MSLEITHEILDQIIFGMEDQEQEYVFDLTTGTVLPVDDASEDDEDDSRYVSLPEWNSSMGFQLMERFVASLRNPMFREDLRESLAVGRGVFRSFKNTLRKRSDIERLWYQFKEREMRRYVADWFESTTEALGLAKLRLDLEDPETLELVLSDFVIDRGGRTDADRIRELDRRAYFEAYDELPEVLVEDSWRKDRVAYHLDTDDVLSAWTPEGELAGFLWAASYTVEGSGASLLVRRLLQVYVEREYRGLGLSRALLDRLILDAYHDEVDVLLAEPGGSAIGLGEKLEDLGFRRLACRYSLDVQWWGRNNLHP